MKAEARTLKLCFITFFCCYLGRFVFFLGSGNWKTAFWKGEGEVDATSKAYFMSWEIYNLLYLFWDVLPLAILMLLQVNNFRDRTKKRQPLEDPHVSGGNYASTISETTFVESSTDSYEESDLRGTELSLTSDSSRDTLAESIKQLAKSAGRNLDEGEGKLSLMAAEGRQRSKSNSMVDSMSLRVKRASTMFPAESSLIEFNSILKKHAEIFMRSENTSHQSSV